MHDGPPFRAEHVGSLLRPPELRRAFRAQRDGGVRAADFSALQDRAIEQAVALQERAGLEVVTDGEFRRGSYWSRFVERVEGLGVREAQFEFQDDSGGRRAFTAPHVEGRLRRTRGISTDEFAFLRSVTSRTTKLTMPSPPTMHFWRGPAGVEDGLYAELEPLFADLAQVYREEIAELGRMGARYVQLDEVPLAMLCDARVREAVRARGEDPDALVSTYIRAINSALAGRPANMVAALHLCRGNLKGSYLSEGSYEAVAERIFGAIEVDAFLLEFDTQRAGGFAPLRFVPEEKLAILGLVSSKRRELESPDDLMQRIDQASKVVPLGQLGLSPQCGFASTAAGNPLTLEDQEAKLRLVVDVARRVWS